MQTQTNATRWVIMGVSGCGKSEVGRALSEALGVPYLEGDSFHSAANIAKMSAGTPLNDDDRAGWLLTLQEQIRNARDSNIGIVLSCSALKRRYRDLLRLGDSALRFAHLSGDRALIETRMKARAGHYMPPSLLDSQLRDLEPLQADEAGIVLDIRAPIAELVTQILQSTAAPK